MAAYISVTLSNDDPFGNNFRVEDNNAGGQTIFNSYIDAHGTTNLSILQNDSGYGNITTYQDNNSGVGRSFLHNGEIVSL